MGSRVPHPDRCHDRRRRLVFFRPHLVVGHDVLVLAGILRTRRLPVAEVRRVVAANRALKLKLKLKLTDGDEVYVPGHFLYGLGRGDCYAYLAQTVNARIAAAAAVADPQDDSQLPIRAWRLSELFAYRLRRLGVYRLLAGTPSWALSARR